MSNTTTRQARTAITTKSNRNFQTSHNLTNDGRRSDSRRELCVVVWTCTRGGSESKAVWIGCEVMNNIVACQHHHPDNHGHTNVASAPEIIEDDEKEAIFE